MIETYHGMKIGRYTEVRITSEERNDSLPEVMFFGPFDSDGYDWGYGLTPGCLKLTADLMADAMGMNDIAVWAVVLVAEALFSDQAPGPWSFTKAQIVMLAAKAIDVDEREKCYTKEVSDE